MLAEFSEQEKWQFRRMRVAILSPIMNDEPQWIRSLANMIGFSWYQGLRLLEMGITEREVIQWARNNLARNALHWKCYLDDKPFTHVLWLDADHVFNPDLACVLARQFVNPEIDMISALYYGRLAPYLPVAYVKDGNPSKYTHYPLIEVPNWLWEVDAVGFGALMMKLDVFKRVPEPWFTLESNAGEDIAFCVKAKEHGVRIFLEGQYKLGHFGERQIVTEAVYRSHLEKNREQYGDRIRVALGGEKL